MRKRTHRLRHRSSDVRRLKNRVEHAEHAAYFLEHCLKQEAFARQEMQEQIVGLCERARTLQAYIVYVLKAKLPPDPLPDGVVPFTGASGLRKAEK